MPEEIGSMEIVGRIDNSQIYLEMEKLRRAMRSTDTETRRFSSSFQVLGKNIGKALTGASGFLGAIINLAKVGPNTAIALEKIGAYTTQVGLAMDKMIGGTVRQAVDAITNINTSQMSSMILGGAAAGIGALALGAGGWVALLAALSGMGAMYMVGNILNNQNTKNTIPPQKIAHPLNEENNMVIDTSSQTTGAGGYMYGQGTSMTTGAVPLPGNISVIENLHVGNISYSPNTNTNPFILPIYR